MRACWASLDHFNVYSPYMFLFQTFYLSNFRIMEDSENSARMGVPPDTVVVGMPSTISTMVKVGKIIGCEDDQGKIIDCEDDQGKIIDCEDDQTTILVAENIFKKFGDGITDGSVFQIKVGKIETAHA